MLYEAHVSPAFCAYLDSSAYLHSSACRKTLLPALKAAMADDCPGPVSG
jgi:hypothetical protein